MRKIRKFIFFKLKIIFLNLVKFVLDKQYYNLLPNLSKNYLNNLYWSTNTKTFFLKNSHQAINIFRIDSTNFKSDLCNIAEKYNTDKSPYNEKGTRHSYTAFYDFLFQSLKNESFNFAEIGIYQNGSIQMFRKYFPNATIYGFDFNEQLLNKAKMDKLERTYYYKIDSSNKKNILENFKNIEKKFKIIIDDSTHIFEHQFNIIESTYNFLEPGGILIIEDISFFKNFEISYKNKLGHLINFFSKIYFVEANHINKYTLANNDRLLVLIKK